MTYRVVGYNEAGDVTGVEHVDFVWEIEAAHDRLIAVEGTSVVRTDDE